MHLKFNLWCSQYFVVKLHLNKDQKGFILDLSGLQIVKLFKKRLGLFLMLFQQAAEQEPPKKPPKATNMLTKHCCGWIVNFKIQQSLFQYSLK